MFALLSGVIVRGGATARFGAGHIVNIALVASHKDQFAGEPIECGHLLRRLPMVEVGDQLLYRFPALSDRAFHLDYGFSAHFDSPSY